MKVYQAIAAVAAELSKEGIAKTRKNTQQGYQFRGIDDVYSALSSQLAKHSLVILPRVIERWVTERETRNGGALFYSVLRVEFDFVSAEDGSKHTICTFGEAMDSGDKSTNKAMSAAYKYACMQAFCIPTEGDNDADAHTHEVASRPTQRPSAGRTQPPSEDVKPGQIPEGPERGKEWAKATTRYLQAVIDYQDSSERMKREAEQELLRRDRSRGAA